MPRLDPEDLKRYAYRDWRAPERLARDQRAGRAVEEKVRLAIELYEAARETVPGWPDDATRRSDFDHHVRICALLERAVDVGAR